MSLKQTIFEHIVAGFSGLWVQSYEPQDAVQAVVGASKMTAIHSRLITWDLDAGLRDYEPKNPLAGGPMELGKALAAVRSVTYQMREQEPPDQRNVILVIRNLHLALKPTDLQTLDNIIQLGKSIGIYVIVISAVLEIRPELEKQFIVLEHDLPGREQLLEIAQGVATEKGEMPEGPQRGALLEAAAGLTGYEAEGAFALSLIRNKKLDAQTVWDIKAQALKKSGLLTIHKGGERFSDLGGLEPLKNFCLGIMQPQDDPLVRAKGVILLGVQGSGKSAFAKALGNETGRVTIIADLGAWMGGIVGKSEENTRMALKLVDAMQPAVLFLDEIDKALGGMSGGEHDSGVGSRMLGSLLTWLNDHTSDVFVVGTSNDISALPPAFTRAERFDGVFFLDFPNAEAQEKIWGIYLDKFKLSAVDGLPECKEWTGAEIRSCCRLARLHKVSLLEAAKYIVPVSITGRKSLDKLREDSENRYLSADFEGLYSRKTYTTLLTTPKRRVQRQQPVGT